MHFAKHETFHIREGWLFKGMAAIKTAENHNQLATIFLDADAPERLGIGRNMVTALRFWMQATGLTQEAKKPQAVQRLTILFGEWVWTNDPYLEDEGTLWLIHYHLVCSKEQATAWYWFFNHFTPGTFSESECLEALSAWVVGELPEQTIALSSLKKDVSCILRTYLPVEKLHTPEDLTESPLARLGLLRRFGVPEGVRKVGSNRQARYQLQRLDPGRLNPLILLYVLVSRQQIERPGTPEVGLGQLLRESMNVGRVFNLTSASLTNCLTILNKQHPDLAVSFQRTAGLDQLTLPNVGLDQILARYMAERTSIRELI